MNTSSFFKTYKYYIFIILIIIVIIYIYYTNSDNKSDFKNQEDSESIKDSWNLESAIKKLITNQNIYIQTKI
jgi:hypothetical protein